MDDTQMHDNELRGEVTAKVAGQELVFKSQALNNLNTIATVFCLIGICLAIYMLFTHRDDAKEGMKLFVEAIKEQTAAVKEQTMVQREQICIIRFPDSERTARAEWCKQVTR